MQAQLSSAKSKHVALPRLETDQLFASKESAFLQKKSLESEEDLQSDPNFSDQSIEEFNPSPENQDVEAVINLPEDEALYRDLNDAALPAQESRRQSASMNYFYTPSEEDH